MMYAWCFLLMVNTVGVADVLLFLPLEHNCSGAITWEYRDVAHPDDFVSDDQARALDALSIGEKLAILKSGKAHEAVYILNSLTRPGATVVANHKLLVDAACSPRAGAILQTVAAGLSMTLRNEPRRDDAVLYLLRHLRKILSNPPPELRLRDLAHIAYDAVAFGYDSYIDERTGDIIACEYIRDILLQEHYRELYETSKYLFYMVAQFPLLRAKIDRIMLEVCEVVLHDATEADKSDREAVVLDIRLGMQRQLNPEGLDCYFMCSQKEYEDMLVQLSPPRPVDPFLKTRLSLLNDAFYCRFSECISMVFSDNRSGWSFLYELRRRPESQRRRRCVDMVLDACEGSLRNDTPRIPRHLLAQMLKFMCPSMIDDACYNTFPSYGSERALAICVALFDDPDPKASETAILSALIALPRVSPAQREMLVKALCPVLAKQEADGKMTRSTEDALMEIMEDHPDILNPQMLQ